MSLISCPKLRKELINHCKTCDFYALDQKDYKEVKSWHEPARDCILKLCLDIDCGLATSRELKLAASEESSLAASEESSLAAKESKEKIKNEIIISLLKDENKISKASESKNEIPTLTFHSTPPLTAAFHPTATFHPTPPPPVTFNPELPQEAIISCLTYLPFINLNALHLLFLQPIYNKEQRQHQNLVSKLLRKIEMNSIPRPILDVDRILLDNNGNSTWLSSWLTYFNRNRRLELLLKNGMNVNRVGKFNNNDMKLECTTLSDCFLSVNDAKINFNAARILMRVNVDVSIKYNYSIGDGQVECNNIYRYCLAAREEPERKHMRKEIEKFIRMIRSYKFFKNVVTRWVCRYRRRKLRDCMLAIVPRLHVLLPIITEYVVLAPIIYL